MKSLLCFLLVAVISPASWSSQQILILGDSLTEGIGVKESHAYPRLLENKINAYKPNKWKVINSGISGSTSASAASRLKWVLKSKPQIIIIALGANDALRGLKPSITKNNLTEAIKLVKKNNIQVILAGIMAPPNYGKKYSDEFKKIYTDISKEEKVQLIPFMLDKVAGNPEYNLADGIHPNEKGHEIISETFFSELKKLL